MDARVLQIVESCRLTCQQNCGHLTMHGTGRPYGEQCETMWSRHKMGPTKYMKPAGRRATLENQMQNDNHASVFNSANKLWRMGKAALHDLHISREMVAMLRRQVVECNRPPEEVREKSNNINGNDIVCCVRHTLFTLCRPHRSAPLGCNLFPVSQPTLLTALSLIWRNT